MLALAKQEAIRDVKRTQAQVRRSLRDPKVLTSLTLLELGQQLSILPKERGTTIESWLQLRGYEKVSSREKRGDHVRNGEYIEVKARFIAERQKKTTITKAGQIRLWQKLSYYLFPVFYTDSDDMVTSAEPYRIPKDRLIDHYKQGHISAKSSSHGAGVLVRHEGDIEYIIENKIELGLSLSRRQYDWTEYLIDEQQLFS